jgi:hypothetical protein
MMKDDLIAIRPTVESDKNFIMATILRGLYYGETWFAEIPKPTFMLHYHKVIEFLLNKDTTEVRIACLKDDPEIIVGYAILSPNINTSHFVFVKKAWRGIGIANSLVPSNTKFATHLTKTGLSIIRKKNIDFNPFLL